MTVTKWVVVLAIFAILVLILSSVGYGANTAVNNSKMSIVLKLCIIGQVMVIYFIFSKITSLL